MKIKNIDIGPNRWYLIVKPDNRMQELQFKSWMSEHHPEVLCQQRSPYHSDSYWEVRGSDLGVKLYIMMRWG